MDFSNKHKRGKLEQDFCRFYSLAFHLAVDKGSHIKINRIPTKIYMRTQLGFKSQQKT